MSNTESATDEVMRDTAAALAKATSKFSDTMRFHHQHSLRDRPRARRGDAPWRDTDRGGTQVGRPLGSRTTMFEWIVFPEHWRTNHNDRTSEWAPFARAGRRHGDEW
jgi:hypothetical protein